MAHTAKKMLRAKWFEGKFVCVGLDSDYRKIPDHLKQRQYDMFMYGLANENDQQACGAIFAFNKAIIDATKDLVAAYKPNLAFYIKQGVAGLTALKLTCEYIAKVAPNVLVILDAKFGDIGNTNDGYISFAFEYLGVDALTIHSYMGRVANQPFLDYADKLFFALCRTSNEGAGEFQNLSIVPSDEPLFFRVAQNVQQAWNSNSNCGLVTGATAPNEILQVRLVATDVPLLIPGIGAQGGELEASVKYAITKQGGFLINSSRGIIFASNGEDFADAAFAATEELDSQIRAVVADIKIAEGWS